MPRLFAALPCALILAATGAHAQTAVSPLQVSSTAQPVLRSGTPVPLRLLETLTTKGKTLRAGYRFRLETAEAVTVNGQIVVPIGSPAVGEITEVRNKGMWGKSGKFAGRMLYVVANGRQIRMSGQMDDKGTAGGAGAVAVSALVFLPAGFFMTGTSASLPIGTPVKGFIDEDVALGFAPAAAPLAFSAPVPVAAPVAVSMPAVVSVPVVANAPLAVTRIAALAPPAPSLGAMPVSAKRFAQRDEYRRLTGQLGLTPDAAKAAVEQEYGMAME